MSKQGNQIFTRRAFILAAGKITLTSMLVSRLFYLQVWRSDHYKILADGNRIRLNFSPPLRGLIRDRNGQILADNTKSFRVVMVRQDVPNVHQALAQISQVVEISDSSKEHILEMLKKVPKFMPVSLHENLNWEQVANIEVRAPELPGIYVDEGLSRSYPNGLCLAPVLGYVQIPDEAKVKENIVYKLPGTKVGKTGIEKYFEESLFGEPGYSEVEVNARGQEIRTLNEVEIVKGKELHLSLDLTLQSQIYERLSQESSACAVVLKIPSGEVLAMSSTPSFDPNLFTQGVSHQQWSNWMESPYKPLLNKVVQAEYAPGSIFKLVTGLAALEHKVITERDQIFCKGYIELGNHHFHCWKKHGHGYETIAGAMRDSCDIFFYEIAKRVGIEKIATMARLLGFGEKTGLELPEERAGLVPDKEWKKRRLGTSWTVGETIIAGIGQGYLSATPMQLAILGARLATKGLAISPTLLLQEEGKEREFSHLKLDSKNINLLLEGMNLAVNAPSGTASRTRINVPGWSLGGKTSTAQVRRVTQQERKEGRKSIPWHLRDHAMFMGVAPMENPKYVMVLVVEHGGWSSASAVPAARDVIRMIYDFDKRSEA